MVLGSIQSNVKIVKELKIVELSSKENFKVAIFLIMVHSQISLNFVTQKEFELFFSCVIGMI